MNGDEGNISDPPWASIFDPAANARAFSAIQAEGFRAASQLVDRFVRIAGDGVSAESASLNGAGNGHGDPAGSDLERLLRSWWSLTGQFLRGSAQLAGAAAGPAESAALDLANAAAEGGLDVQANVPGVVTAEVWLHNRGAVDRGDVRLRCSDLLAHDGSLIPGEAVWFDPAVVPMPARSSRGVVVRIEVDQGLTPAPYRGTVLAEGQPQLWLPVVVTVGAHGL